MREPSSPGTAGRRTDPMGFGRSWTWSLAMGIVTLVAGILLLSWPHETVKVIAVLIGLQFLVIGGIRFVTTLTRDETGAGDRVLSYFLALLAILVGVLCLRHPLQSIGVITLLVGVFWLLGGLVTVGIAVASQELTQRGLTLAFGALGIIAGVVVLAYPVGSAVALARLLGLWLLLLGLAEVLLAVGVWLLVHRQGAKSPGEPG